MRARGLRLGARLASWRIALGGAMALAATFARPARATPPPLDVQAVAPCGSMPKGATLSPDGRLFYVANFGQENAKSVSVYDARTLAEVATFGVPGIVVESVLSPDGATLFLSNFERDSVQMVDTRTRRVTREVKVGSHPKIMVLSRDGATLFAANWNGESVSEIDVARGKVVRTLAVGKHPRGMALTRAGTLYVANFDGASIDVFTGQDRKDHHRIPACAIPRHLALSPDEKTLYVSCYHSSAVEALDLATETVAHHVPVGPSPKSLEVTPDGRFVFTADYGVIDDGTGDPDRPRPPKHGDVPSGVSVVDTHDWTARVLTIPGMNRGSGVAIAPDGVHALVTGWNDNHVYLVGFAGTEARASRLPIAPWLPGSTNRLEPMSAVAFGLEQRVVTEGQLARDASQRHAGGVDRREVSSLPRSERNHP